MSTAVIGSSELVGGVVVIVTMKVPMAARINPSAPAIGNLTHAQTTIGVIITNKTAVKINHVGPMGIMSSGGIAKKIKRSIALETHTIVNSRSKCLRDILFLLVYARTKCESTI